MALSLKDVQSRMIEVPISSPDGYEQTVTIGSLSFTEWNNAAIGVDFPSPPTKRMLTDKGNQDIFDYNDPSYRNEINLANDTVTFRRVVISLIKGGNFAELKGLDLEAQCRELEGMDYTIVQGVAEALSQLARHTKGGVETKKANFQGKPLPENGNGNLREGKETPLLVELAKP